MSDTPPCTNCARLQRYAETAWSRGHRMGIAANAETARRAMDGLRKEKEAHADTNARLTEDNMRLERDLATARAEAEAMRARISDDALAMSCQTLGQYRAALLARDQEPQP